MTTGDEACDAGTTVLELSEIDVDVDVAAAVRRGVRVVRLTTPCRLTPDDPAATLALVRLLREAAGDHVPVEWRGQLPHGVDPMLLLHLTPPASSTEDASSLEMMSWQTTHRPGLCYYRLGPGFVFVKDVRAPDASARFRLEGDDKVRAFRALEAVVEVDSLDAITRELLDDLEGERLALRLGRFATMLPSRMRRWPVPSHEV